VQVKHQLNKAILDSLMGKYSLYIFQIISLAILSRIFTPEMFGVIAAFQVFILFFQLLATSGLAPAIIYKGSLSKVERNGIFTVSLLIGVFGSLTFFYSTPYLAVWLNLENVSILSWVLAFNVLFSSLSMLPMAALQQDSKFLVLAKAEITSEVCSLVITLGLFYLGFGIEALASKLLFVPIFRFIFYYINSSNTFIGQPQFGSNLSAMSTLMSFAKYQLAFNVLNYFSRNLDTILLTKYFGVATVGFYEKSYQVMRYPLQLFTFAITPALQPVLTKYKDQVDIIEKEYYPIAFKLAMLGFFVAWVLFWGAEEVVYIMFGPQWHEAAHFLSLLSVSIPLQMVLSSTGGIYQAVGKPKLQFYCGLFSSIINISMIVLGVYFSDLVLLCQLLVTGFIINFIQCFWIMQCKIFNRKFNAGLLIIFFIILCPYINLLFFDVVEHSAVQLLTYQGAFYHLLILGGSSLFVTGVLYFYLQKNYWK